MPRTNRGKACILIEGSSPKETLILALENLASNNKKIEKEISDCNTQLDQVKKIIRKI